MWAILQCVRTFDEVGSRTNLGGTEVHPPSGNSVREAIGRRAALKPVNFSAIGHWRGAVWQIGSCKNSIATGKEGWVGAGEDDIIAARH